MDISIFNSVGRFMSTFASAPFLIVCLFLIVAVTFYKDARKRGIDFYEAIFWGVICAWCFPIGIAAYFIYLKVR